MNFMMTVFMQSYIAIGVSLPREIIQEIDNERGDIPRSRYILRVLQRKYNLEKLNRQEEEKTKEYQETLDCRLKDLTLSDNNNS